MYAATCMYINTYEVTQLTTAVIVAGTLQLSTKYLMMLIFPVMAA